MTISRMLHTWKDWSTRQQGPPNLVSGDRGLQCWSGCSDQLCNCDSFVAPWVGSTKVLGEVSEISSDYLLKDHCCGILALVLSVKLMGMQYNTPALSCCKENIFGEHYLSIEGTLSMFGKDQPVGGSGQAWPDVEHCDWHPITLLYFSSCKNFDRPLHLVWYLDY